MTLLRSRRIGRRLVLIIGGWLAVAGGFGVPTSAQAACLSSVDGALGVTTTYVGCDGVQRFVVPDGSTKVAISLIGGQGSSGFSFPGHTGGAGGRVDARLDVTAGQVLFAVVGGAAATTRESGRRIAGGFNGGAAGGQVSGGAGGGASDLRTISCEDSCPGAVGSATLASRLVVAGGGGGAGGSGRDGGDGGSGPEGNGQDGEDLPTEGAYSGRGGTQTDGGAGGIPFNSGPPGSPGVEGAGGDAEVSYSCGGGGGGGWFGGGGASVCTAGGGGSSHGPAGATFSTSRDSASIAITPLIGTTTTVTASLNPAPVYQVVTFTAKVTKDDGSPAVDGTVRLLDAGQPVGDPIPVVDGEATSSIAFTDGSHEITAEYSGGATTDGSLSDPLIEQVDLPRPVFAGVDPGSIGASLTPRLRGVSDIPGLSVEIFTTADCSGSPVAVDTSDQFSSGIEVSVAENTTTTFYADFTRAVRSACSDPITYTSDTIAPTVSLSRAAPPIESSGGKPLLVGATDTDDGVVTVYASGDCSGSAVVPPGGWGIFLGGDLAGGVPVPVVQGSNTFTATVTDKAGNVSDCSNAVTFTWDTIAPARPTITGSTPASPSASLAPRLRGTAEAGATVRLYASADCSGEPVASGTAAAFADPGLAVTVDADRATTFHATATDASGNASGCSDDGYTYRQQTPPSPTPNPEPSPTPTETPAPALTPAPSVPTPTPAPLKVQNATTAPPPTVCRGHQLILALVDRGSGAKVDLAGIASAPAGSTITITGTGGATGGHAVVEADGSFALTVEAPPRRQRATARYRARFGSLRSAALQLTRQFTLDSQRAVDGGVRVVGHIRGGTAGGRVDVTRQLDCTKTVSVRRVPASKAGKVAAVLARPTSGVAIYRLRYTGADGHIAPTLPIVVRAGA